MRSFPTEEGRRMCRELWERTLVALGVGFVLIRGDGEERLERAIRAVTAIQGSKGFSQL
jgi:nicotinamide riboside kinase